MLRCTSIVIAILIAVTFTSVSLGQREVADNFPKILNDAIAKRSSTEDSEQAKAASEKPALDNATAVTKPRSETKPRSVKNAPVVPGVIAKLSDSPKQIDEDVRREIEAKVTADLEQKFKAQFDALAQQNAALQARAAQQSMATQMANRQAMLPPGNSAQPPANSTSKSGASFTLNDFTLSDPLGSQAANPVANTQSQPSSKKAEPVKPTDPKDESQTDSNPTTDPIPAPSFSTSTRKPTAIESQEVETRRSDQSVLELSKDPKVVLETKVIGPESMTSAQPDEFDITITNKDGNTATDIVVQLQVPPTMTISRLDREAFLDPENRTVSWKIGSLLPGQQETIRYQAVSATAGSHDHKVTVGMRNTFQGATPFETLVKAATPTIDPSEVSERRVEVAERPQLEK